MGGSLRRTSAGLVTFAGISCQTIRSVATRVRASVGSS
jgi:hypothetical protein